MKEAYQTFVAVFRAATGMDLLSYNQAQVIRRLEPLLKKHQLSFVELAEKMVTNRELVQETMDRLTIHYSEFFRDKSFWTILRKHLSVLATNSSILKAWSAGCGNGEEAWSLAFYLEEFFPGGNYTIIASDIDSEALKQASRGLYSHVKGMTDTQAVKYFDVVPQGFEVKMQYRSKVKFLKLDLLQDHYPEQLHLILCRNVLIYFHQRAKANIGRQMAMSLQRGGLLCLGNTEYIENADLKQLTGNIYIK